METNTIRAIIFLIAGLVLIIFPEKLIKMQSKILRKFNVKQTDTKSTTRILGIIFLIIALVLWLVF
jgi:uncharacterized membrane protein